jgi:hypothetical protein
MAKPRITRFFIYTGVILASFGVAYLHGITVKNKKRAQELQELKREINSHWGLTKIEIDTINESAQSFAERFALKPGDPLPPKELAKENPTLRAMLKNMSTFYRVSTFSAASENLSTMVTTIITIGDRVPPEGEKYSYGAIEHSYELFGSVYSIYPEDNFSIQRIKSALKAYAKTLKLNKKQE